MKKKRRLLKNETDSYADMLKNETAYAVQSKLADKYMDEDDYEPPYLPTVNCLRKIRSKAQCPNISSLMSLLSLKKNCRLYSRYIIGPIFRILFNSTAKSLL